MRRVIVTAGPSVRELEEQFFFILCDAHSGSTVRRFQCYTSTQRQSHTLFFSLYVCGWCVFYEKSPAGLIVDGYGLVVRCRTSDCQIYFHVFICVISFCVGLSLSQLSPISFY